MKQVTTTVYTYAELTPAAQGKARDWYRTGEDIFFAEPTIEDATTVLELLGYSDTEISAELRHCGRGLQWWALRRKCLRLCDTSPSPFPARLVLVLRMCKR